MVSDLAKQQSDDTTLTERHIAFLLNKYRTYLLKQKYLNKAQEIPLSNYQTICADMTLVPAMAGCTYEQCMDGDNSPLLRSIEKVDLPLTFSDTKVSLLKCPGEFSIKVKNVTKGESVKEYSTQFLTAESYKYLIELFDIPYLPIYPAVTKIPGEESGETWVDGHWEHEDIEEQAPETFKALFPGGYEVYQSTWFADYAYLEMPEIEDLPQAKIMQCWIWYNKQTDRYWINQVTEIAAGVETVLDNLPLSSGNLYRVTCSDDAQTLIDLLNRHGVKAELDVLELSNGSCNETMFYTNAIRQFNGILVVDRERFNYVGHSKYYRSNGYATIGIDNRLYVKSDKDLSAYAAQYNTETGEAGIPTGKALITAIFENPDKAYEHSSCTYKDSEGHTVKCPEAQDGICDPWDREFPIEDALQTQLISLVLKDIYGGSLRPKDGINNANDDLSSIENFVRSAMKERYARDNGINPQ